MRLSQLVDKLVKLVDKFAGVALPVLLAGVALPVPVELSMVDVAGVHPDHNPHQHPNHNPDQNPRHQEICDFG